MITAQSGTPTYQTAVRSGAHELIADVPRNKGGAGAGFGAHELLEAALAACINMAVRMQAEREAVPLQSVATLVELKRPDAESICFEYSLELVGTLSEAQRRLLERAALTCPVRQTLSKTIRFHAATSVEP